MDGITHCYKCQIFVQKFDFQENFDFNFNFPAKNKQSLNFERVKTKFYELFMFSHRKNPKF